MPGDTNEQLRRLAEKLPRSEETKFGFNCECGCGTVVAVTPIDFDAYGAWAHGHRPEWPPSPATPPAAA